MKNMAPVQTSVEAGEERESCVGRVRWVFTLLVVRQLEGREKRVSRGTSRIGPSPSAGPAQEAPVSPDTRDGSRRLSEMPRLARFPARRAMIDGRIQRPSIRRGPLDERSRALDDCAPSA